MSRMGAIRCATVCTGIIFASATYALAPSVQGPPPVTNDSAARQMLVKVPLSFEANQGQVDSSVKFLSRGDGYALYLTSGEAVFKLANGPDSKGAPSVLRMRLLGARDGAEVTGVDKLAGIANYFIGNDPARWHAGVPTYGKVNYRGIYPGVDAVFYGNQRELEYDFRVAPGADPGRIAMAFTGATPKIDRAGDVVLSLDGQNVTLHKPLLYQGEGSQRRPIDGRYVVAGNSVRLRVGSYDHSQPLVIDPVISYLTYLGGHTGTRSGAAVPLTTVGCVPGACPEGIYTWIRGQGVAVDSGGNLYVGGLTFTTDFPTQNPLQAANKAPSINVYTGYVAKLNPSGTGLIYATYLGGSGGNGAGDEVDSIAIDAAGNAYVAGATDSGDFPTTPGAYKTTCPIQGGTITYCQTNNGSFLTKLSPDGQSLVYSTYVMTLGNSDQVHGLAVDAQGRAYVVGDDLNYGNSAGSTTPDTFFPTTTNALLPWTIVDQAVHPGVGSPGMATLAVFSADGSRLVYATLFGDAQPWLHMNIDAGPTRATGVAVDPTGNIYLSGVTQDPYIPVTANAFQPARLAGNATVYRGFVAKLSSVDADGGPQLVYGTYLGATNTVLNASDLVAGIAADADGNAYVTGTTANSDFPTTAGAYSRGCAAPPAAPTYCYNSSFLTKIKPDGTGLAWSTFVAGAYGGVDIGAILAPLLDSRGNVYVAVQADTPAYPAVNPVQTPTGTSQRVGISKFDPTGSKLFFSTLLGSPTGLGSYGSSDEFPGGLAVDPDGNIYVGGMIDSDDLPTTPGAFQITDPINSHNWTGFLARIDPFLTDSTALVVAPSAATVGQTVSFTATVNTNNAGTATGTVNFMNGATLLGSGTLDAQGVATFSTSTLAAGSYSVTAAYLGDDTFAKSTSNPQALTVGLAPQSITFGALPNVAYGVAPITLAASASSGLPVSYGVTGPATLNGSALTITGVGTVSVTASQAGNGSFAPAANVVESFTVAPAVLTVTATNASITYGQPIPSFSYTATGFVNGDTSSVLSGTPLETTTATSSSPAGSYPITITQGSLAAANYSLAFVAGTLTISGGATQTITFGALPNVTYGVAPITLTATASSGLPVSYAVTGPATLNGSVLTVTGVGTVNVTASQAGNGSYGAATPVTRSFTVAPAVLTVTATNASIAYGQPIPSLTYTATGFVNGDTASVLSGTPVESTTATSSSPVGSYPITIVKGTLAAANYSFTFVSGVLTINKAAQTITFDVIPAQTVGATVNLSASASSGLPVSFASLTTTVCSETGTTRRCWRREPARSRLRSRVTRITWRPPR